MRLKPVLYSSNPRLQPMRLRMYLRQPMCRRMCARWQRKRKVRKSKVHKRKANCAACSFARGAVAKILRLIDSADTAALLGTLLRLWQMRRANLRLRLPLCQYLRRRKPRLRLHLRRRKQRLPLRLCRRLRRRMPILRQRKRKVRRRKMYGRKFRRRKPNCAAFWRGFAARLRRFPTGL